MTHNEVYEHQRMLKEEKERVRKRIKKKKKRREMRVVEGEEKEKIVEEEKSPCGQSEKNRDKNKRKIGRKRVNKEKKSEKNNKIIDGIPCDDEDNIKKGDQWNIWKKLLELTYILRVKSLRMNPWKRCLNLVNPKWNGREKLQG